MPNTFLNNLFFSDVAINICSFRFASFIEGQSHLSDQEMLEYEASIVDEDEYTDDEEDNYTDDEY